MGLYVHSWSQENFTLVLSLIETKSRDMFRLLKNCIQKTLWEIPRLNFLANCFLEKISTFSEKFADIQQNPFLHLPEDDKARFRYVLYDGFHIIVKSNFIIIATEIC